MAKENKTVLREEAERINVVEYVSYRDYLRALYFAAKKRLNSYSYLRFADDLGFSLTNVMRLVIIGKRPLTSKAAEKIAKALELHGVTRRYWTTMVKYNNARLPAEREKIFRTLMGYKTKVLPSQLDQTQMEYLSEWYHPVIREMVGLKDFDGNPQWIKDRLAFPLRLEQIKKSLEILERLQVIQYDSSKERWIRSEDNISTDAEIDSLAIVRYHQKMIEIGRESITRVDENKRDIRAVTVTLPEKAVPVLKGKIREWLSEVMTLEDNYADGNDVYQINIQLFPFTRQKP